MTLSVQIASDLAVGRQAQHETLAKRREARHCGKIGRSIWIERADDRDGHTEMEDLRRDRDGVV